MKGEHIRRGELTMTSRNTSHVKGGGRKIKTKEITRYAGQ
jgi:hypothetical protein